MSFRCGGAAFGRELKRKRESVARRVLPACPAGPLAIAHESATTQLALALKRRRAEADKEASDGRADQEAIVAWDRSCGIVKLTLPMFPSPALPRASFWGPHSIPTSCFVLDGGRVGAWMGMITC